MADLITFFPLLHAMLRASADPAEVQRSKEVMQWVAENTKVLSQVLHADEKTLITYAFAHWRDFQSAPSRSNLEELVRKEQFPEGPNNVLKEYDSYVVGVQPKPIDVHDIPLHFQNRRDDWRKSTFVDLLKQAKMIAEVGMDIDKKTTMKGVDDAWRYIQQERAKDPTLPFQVQQGPWREKADEGANDLIEGLRDTIRERVYTGFKHIDSVVTIGPKQSVKYIGILGFSNHGKSMVLRQMAYNMAVSGKRILYVPREDSPKNTWQQLSFLHAWTRPDLDIPNVNVWRNQPEKVTAQQQDNLLALVDDIKSGDKVPGEIVVKSLGKWTDIVAELQNGHNNLPYDVLMIDYLSHLETENSRNNDIHEEIRKYFKQAQALCQDYQGGRGLVIVTPLQAGKTPMAAAAAQEGDDWGVYSDLGAVDFYTGACRDMDLVLGVWQKDALKHSAMLKIHCLKSREDFFDTHFVAIDTRTRAIMDLPGKAKLDVDKIAVYRRELATGVSSDPNDVDVSGL
jgi:archaellum biogenesis ATPase FlaH